jgi:hypothetical protein
LLWVICRHLRRDHTTGRIVPQPAASGHIVSEQTEPLSAKRRVTMTR